MSKYDALKISDTHLQQQLSLANRRVSTQEQLIARIDQEMKTCQESEKNAVERAQTMSDRADEYKRQVTDVKTQRWIERFLFVITIIGIATVK